MEYSPAYVISKYLKDQSLTKVVGGNADWQAYVGSLPDGETEDKAIAIIDSPSVKDGRLMTGSNIWHYGFQLLLRSRNYNDGWKKAIEIAEAFESVNRASQVVGDYTYTLKNITQTSAVLVLGQEPDSRKRRELFSANFLLTIEENAS